jgi:hypothetical protein
MQFLKSEFLVDNPKYTSINQRKEESLKEARVKAGLDIQPSDVKETNKDPSLSYITKPTFATKTLLEKQRKDEMVNNYKKLDPNYTTFKDVKARIDERENCHLRLGYKDTSGRTKG